MVGEPGITAVGAEHANLLTVALDEGARVGVLEQVQLGRFEESPGRWSSRTRIERAGRVVFDSSLDAGTGAAGWESAAVHDGAPSVAALVVVDPDGLAARPVAQWREEDGTRAAVTFGASGDAAQVCAWGRDLAACRRLIAGLAGDHGFPGWCPVPGG